MKVLKLSTYNLLVPYPSNLVTLADIRTIPKGIPIIKEYNLCKYGYLLFQNICYNKELKQFQQNVLISVLT